MNEAIMQKVAKELVDLSNELGNGENGDRKFKIPASRSEALEFIQQYNYKLAGAYSIDDPQVTQKVRELVKEGYRMVWAVMNTSSLKYEIYTPPDKKTWSQINTSANNISTSNVKSGCFIATAVYGSQYENEVLVLKDFRDNWLMKYKLGETFVKLYYWFSPPFANQIAKSNSLKKITKTILIIPLLKLANSIKSEEK